MDAMASKRTHRLSVRVGTYTTADSQQPKIRSREIGHLFTDENGRMFLRIHAEQLNPILASMAKQKGDDDVLIGVWPIEPRELTGHQEAETGDNPFEP